MFEFAALGIAFWLGFGLAWAAQNHMAERAVREFIAAIPADARPQFHINYRRSRHGHDDRD